jgi:peptidoglycan/LPS O-acetylase OafA/YrhL
MKLVFLTTFILSFPAIDQSQVLAFANPSSSSSVSKKILPPTTYHNRNPNPKNPNMVLTGNLSRGGGSEALKTALNSSDGSASAAKPAKKVRILSLDGMRFFLCMHIVLGHFLRFANPSDFLLKFFAQINVTVGAFFALSGYVAAYTTTEVGQRKASARLTSAPSQQWWLSKCMGYYPMHWLVLLLFSPMFIFTDVTYQGWPTAILHGIMSLLLIQSWFPNHAEVWNAPTWYLSSFTFANALLPFSIPKIAEMDKTALSRTSGWLLIIKMLPVLGYLYDHNAWSIVEGMTAPKAHPNLAIFNVQRFHPMLNVADILLGVVACRIAMLDGLDDKDKPIKTSWLSTALPFAGLFATLALRATNLVPECSDLLVRNIIFTPLFLKFMMGSHRNTVAGIKDPLSSFLSSNAMVFLGGLTFPIFIVHGPIGQVFYKKLIATKLWGQVLKGPGYFGIYLGTVFLAAWLLQNFFLSNKAVGAWSKKKAESWSEWM